MASQGSKCKENRWESSFWDVCLNADKDSVPLCKYMYIYTQRKMYSIYKYKNLVFGNLALCIPRICSFINLFLNSHTKSLWNISSCSQRDTSYMMDLPLYMWSNCGGYKDKWSGPPFFLMGLRLFVKTHNLTYNYWKKCLLSTVTPFNLPKQVWFSSVWRNETSIGEKHVQSIF